MSRAFEVTHDVREGVRILTVAGELDLATAGAVREPLDAAGDGLDRHPLVIDLSECEFIDSTGLATLAHGTRALRSRGLGVAVACPPGEIRQLLRLSALDLTLPAHDTLGEAIAAVSPAD